MACRILKNDGFFEISVTGKTNKYEILETVRELHRRDPRKELPDLWVVSRESEISLARLVQIAEEVAALFPPGLTGNKTALVASDELHMAELEIYRSEAVALPLEMRVFTSRAAAVTWLTGSDAAGS